MIGFRQNDAEEFMQFFIDSLHEAVRIKIPESSIIVKGDVITPTDKLMRDYCEYYSKYQEFNIDNIVVPNDLVKVGKFLFSLPNIASKKWIYEQYDSMVGTNNVSTNNPSDAGVALIKGTYKGIAMSVDCNSRYAHADPEIGTAIDRFNEVLLDLAPSPAPVRNPCWR